MALNDHLKTATRDLGVVVHAVKLTGADSLDAAFEAMARDRPDAVAVAGDLSFFDRHVRICALASKHRIPIFAHTPEFAEAGCLAGFGASRRAMYRRSATYVKKIFDGARPADLPVELPTHVELAINLKTAHALGLNVPRSLLVRADKVIE
jgi:putative ABC transport system substrate-binding protein